MCVCVCEREREREREREGRVVEVGGARRSLAVCLLITCTMVSNMIFIFAFINIECSEFKFDF